MTDLPYPQFAMHSMLSNNGSAPVTIMGLNKSESDELDAIMTMKHMNASMLMSQISRYKFLLDKVSKFALSEGRPDLAAIADEYKRL